MLTSTLRVSLTAATLIAAVSTGLSQVKNNTTPVASVTDCGVGGNRSTDDTSALNQCIANLPDYHILTIPAGLKIKITGTINIHGKHGIRLQGLTSMYGGPSATTEAPSIYWYGPAGGTMFDIDNAGPFMIEGVTLFSSPDFGVGSGGAAIGFNVDQTLNLGVTTTNGVFERVALLGTQQNPGFIGIAFSRRSLSNVEHMTVRDSTITCSYNTNETTSVGTGILIGPSANAKKHYYVNNSISGCATGIYLTNGSADIVHNQFNTNRLHIYADPTDPIAVKDNDSEHASQFFKGTIFAGGQFVNNRISSVSPPAGVGAVQFTGGATILFEGNSFDAGSFIPVSGQGAPYGAPALISRGNRYPNTTQTIAGWMTFGYNVVSELDGFGSGLAIVASKGTANPTPPTAGLGLLNYDYPSQKWVVSENAKTYKNLIADSGAPDPGCSYIGRVWLDTTTNSTVEKHCLSVSGTLTWVTK